MKKIRILLYFISLFLILCISCKKEPTGSETRFSATTSDYTKGDAKTTMVDFSPLWSAGDQFYVWGSDLTPHRCKTSDSGSPTAVFQYDTLPAAPVSGPYTAIYPSMLYVSPTRILVPPSQESVSGALTNAPMYASSSTTDLVFQNLCGAIRIKLSGENAKRIYYVIISSNQRINGQFDLVDNPDNPACPNLTYAEGGSTNNILYVSNSAQGDGTYYIALPPGTYNTLSAYLFTVDRTSCSVSLSNGSPVTLRQGAVTSFILNNLTFH